jgi:hypothetical protein
LRQIDKALVTTVTVAAPGAVFFHAAIDIALCNMDGGGADLQSQRIARGCAANQYE